MSAPIFIAVFGLSADEMPADDIITIEVLSLTAGSHQNVYCSGSGFITFVRGNYTIDNGTQSDNHEIDESLDDTTEKLSKESQIAEIYHRIVYYPFIRNIRISKYGHSGNDEDISDHLQAVSWMDGCNAQLKLITSEANHEKERSLKITCCKHSASRTAMEQAADTC